MATTMTSSPLQDRSNDAKLSPFSTRGKSVLGASAVAKSALSKKSKSVVYQDENAHATPTKSSKSSTSAAEKSLDKVADENDKLRDLNKRLLAELKNARTAMIGFAAVFVHHFMPAAVPGLGGLH